MARMRLLSAGDLTIGDVLVLLASQTTIEKLWDGPKKKSFKDLKSVTRKLKDILKYESHRTDSVQRESINKSVKQIEEI